MVADVRHHVGLGGEQILQGLDPGRQVIRLRLRRRGGRRLLAAAEDCHEDERKHGQRSREPGSCSHFSWLRPGLEPCADSPWIDRTRLTALGGLS